LPLNFHHGKKRIIEAPRRKRRGTILTSIASNLRSFFCLLFLCSLTPKQATGNRVYELGEANALAGFNIPVLYGIKICKWFMLNMPVVKLFYEENHLSDFYGTRNNPGIFYL